MSNNMPPAPKKARRSEMSRLPEESVYCEDDDDSPFSLFFLKFEEPDEENLNRQELQMHQEVFELAERNGVLPQWIEFAEIEALARKEDYFIVPAFRGPIFETLTSEGYRIFGGPILAECLIDQKPLPLWEHPVYSNIFENVKLTFTSVNLEKRKELKNQVKWMNGTVSENFYEEIGYLVVGNAAMKSEKYKIATRNKVKLMKVEWIEELWRKTQMVLTRDVRASSEDVVNSYQLPVFLGTNMSVTNINVEDRGNIMKLVEQNGGQISVEMRKTTCTHLVTDTMSGRKFRKAEEWGTVRIVQLRWVRKCAELGYMIDESKYHPKYLVAEQAKSSTPLKQSEAVNVTHFESAPDVSSIMGPGGKLNTSANTSSILTPVQNQAAIQGGRIFSRTSSFVGVSYTDNLEKTIVKKNAPKDPIDEIEIAENEDSDIFEGCMIWICGVEDQGRKDKWRKLLDRTGATRVQRIELATHVVVVAASKQEQAVIRKNERSDICVVTAQWVVECLRSKDLVSVDEYLWSEANMDETMTQQTPSTSSAAPKSQIQRQSTDSSTKTTWTTLTKLSEASTKKLSGIFAPLKFAIHPSIEEAEIREKLRKLISENGGEIEGNLEKKVDYVIFGHSAPIDLLISFDAIVTYLYIESCASKKQLMEISAHSLFVPLPQPPGRIFWQNTFALCSRNLNLNNYVRRLIETNGGTVVETENVQPVGITEIFEKSHLQHDKTYVVTMSRIDVSKMDEVQRNRMVDLSWIVSSISKCRLQPVKEHLFGGEPLKGFIREDDIWDKYTSGKELTQEMQQQCQIDRSDLTMAQQAAGGGGGGAGKKSDMTKDFKMRLNLKGAHEIIDNIPSPCRDGDDTLTTSKIGRILEKAVVNTGRYGAQSAAEKEPERFEVTQRKAVSSMGRIFPKEMTQPPMQEQQARFEIQRKFVLSVSNLTAQERERMREDIIGLGGSVLEDYTWEATHLICPKMSRTPKTLSAIAAGKWCLPLNYVIDSVREGRWIEEDEYEWTLDKLDPSAKAIEKNLTKVCSIWRKRIAKMPITCSIASESRHNGAYTGWRCVFHSGDDKALAVISILEAGGASVSTVGDYIEILEKRPTIVFVSQKFAWNPQSAAILKREQIPLLTFDYVYEYLIDDSVDMRKFLHSTFEKC